MICQGVTQFSQRPCGKPVTLGKHFCHLHDPDRPIHMPQRAEPKQDGFHWEEWRDGVLISRGWNDATEQPIWNASRQVSELCVAITATAIDKALYGKKNK